MAVPSVNCAWANTIGTYMRKRFAAMDNIVRSSCISRSICVGRMDGQDQIGSALSAQFQLSMRSETERFWGVTGNMVYPKELRRHSKNTRVSRSGQL
ncbi:hypothetical protein E4U53_006382, partial [Claviceps sorghi]